MRTAIAMMTMMMTGVAIAQPSDPKTAALFTLVAAKQCADTRGDDELFAQAVEQAETQLAEAGASEADIEDIVARVANSAPEDNPVACGLYERSIAE